MRFFQKFIPRLLISLTIFTCFIFTDVQAIELNNLSFISRKEVQERAYKMGYDVWHFVKRLNGNEQKNTELPSHLKSKEDSYEYGIPYNWGGYDGIDTTSSSRWKNYSDALSKGALAGNVNCSGGYKGSTAGIDCSGFVQSTLKIPGSKQSTWTLGDYMSNVGFSQLKNMDVLLWKSDHVAFFQSWVYDDKGKKIGANTIESTGGNNDGTGKKVKQYYRPLDEIYKNYEPMRYNDIGNDFIEDNSKPPLIESPLINEVVKKDAGNIKFKWTFNDSLYNGYETAYRVRVYSGKLSEDWSCGKFIKLLSEDANKTEVTMPINDLPIGDYYFVIETKNNRGYWSSPISSPFKITEGTVVTPKKVENRDRYGGTNRYETSKIIAEATFKGKVDAVVLTYAENFPDGVCGATLAYKYNAPILLVQTTVSNGNNQCALDYISTKLNKTGKIYLLGSAGVIDNSYIDYFTKQGFSKNNIIRLGGQDRNDTSVKIAESLNVAKGTPVVIAWDSGFADALTTSPIAAKNGWPILITKSNYLPASLENYLLKVKPSKVYVVGSSGVVSDAVRERIQQILNLSDDNIKRLSGSNRYETCDAINNYFYKGVSKVYMGYGENFPDSLCGSVMAAKNNSPIVLLSDDYFAVSSSIVKKVSGTNKIDITVFGSNKLLSNYLISKVENLCK